MFVGHALLAFALVALGARRWGLTRERAIAVGALAAAFAAVPDVDILYAPAGLLAAGDALGVEAFWETGNVVHRSITHALPIGGALAAAAWLWSLRPSPGSRGRIATAGALGIVGAVVAVATLLSDPLAGLVAGVSALSALAVTAVATGRGATPREVFAAATVGLLSHPFGDLFTGSPPPLLYPFPVPVVTDRVVLSPEPTLNLLAAFGIELAVVWLAAVVYFRLRGRRLPALVAPRATVGVGYAGATLALPPPTVEAAYQFVFSVLAVGVVGSVDLGARGRTRAAGVGPLRVADPPQALVTGLSAVTVAYLAYGVAYLLLY